MTRDQLRLGIYVLHTTRRKVGEVISLDTGDDTSCIVRFNDDDDCLDDGGLEVSIHFLKEIH